jgi:Lon protease-like protein
MSTSAEMRRGVEIPILDLTESQEKYNEHMQPLPSAHLPDELTTVHVYGMQLTRPVHQMVVEETVNRGENVIGVGTAAERAFGHIAYKPLKDSLVGAIGCTAQVLMVAPTSPEEIESLKEGEMAPMTVLCRGSYRFIVREVIKTIPFPVAIVDELIDDEPTIGPTSTETDEDVEDEDDEEDDDDEDEDDVYADLTPSELVQRTLMAMKTHVDQQVNILERDMTPLEQSIVQDSSTDLDMNAQRQAAEETSAVFSTFAASLPDIAPTPGQIYFTVAMMAAELSNLNNNARRAFLRTTNGVERLRLVLGVMEEMVGMSRARKMASEITEETDEDSKDLKVGEPVLPPWAKSIRKGARLEYYWNEEWGWSEGEVVEDPVMVVNELLLTVQFDQDEDGTVQRLPFTPDDKVRWRPPQLKD